MVAAIAAVDSKRTRKLEAMRAANADRAARDREDRAAAAAARVFLPPIPRALVDGDRVLDRIATWRDDGAAAARRAWTPRAGLPGDGTRASCPPPSEACPFVLCKFHLARTESESRPGRRGAGRALPEASLRPLWLDGNAETCSLHEADRTAASGEPMEVAAVARAIGVSMRMAGHIQRDALAKLGISPRDIAAITYDAEVAPRRRARTPASRPASPDEILAAISRLVARGESVTRGAVVDRWGVRGVAIVRGLVAEHKLRVVDVVVQERTFAGFAPA